MSTQQFLLSARMFFLELAAMMTLALLLNIGLLELIEASGPGFNALILSVFAGFLLLTAKGLGAFVDVPLGALQPGNSAGKSPVVHIIILAILVLALAFAVLFLGTNQTVAA